jgi:predicted permease
MIARLFARLYAALLFAYPAELRRTHGAHMRQCARTALADRGAAAIPRLLFDLAVSVPREWRDEFKGVSVTRFLAGAGRDVVYALRLFWRSPGFSAAAIVTLALGIGANTAIFTLADATVFRPIQVRDPGQLVAFKWSASLPDYREWAERTDLFTGVAASLNVRVVVTIDGIAEPIDTAFVSPNYFPVLGVGVSAGRAIGPGDDASGGDLAIVLDREWWRTRMGANPAAIGSVIHVSGVPATIVGIAPEGFHGTTLQRSPRIYLPLASVPRLLAAPFNTPGAIENRGMVFLNAVGRLRDDVPVAAAQAAMNAMYVRQHPEDAGPGADPFELESMKTRALGGPDAGSVYTFVGLLGGVVALTLLIGCANLANLQLARAAARQREIGVRLAIGAGRGRIVRQLLTESLVLALAGGALGVIVASYSLRLIARFQLPGGIDINGLGLGVDRGALAFAFLTAGATVLFFGVAPAWQAARGNALASLRGQSRTTASGRLRSVLVAVQIALSLVLLTGTALFLRSFNAALQVPLGFVPAGVATTTLTASAKGFDRARARQFFDTALDKVRQLPDVTAAAWTNVLPISGSMSMTATIEGSQKKPGEDTHVYVANVGPEYFAAAGIRLKQGRVFQTTDRIGTPLVGIVNETAARRFWNGRNPLDGRVRVDDEHFIQIVGVVEDTKIRSLDEPPSPYMYMPFAQPSGPFAMDRGTLLVRTSGDVNALLPRLRDQLRAADPAAPLTPVTTFARQVRRLVMPQQMGVAFFGTFALLALTLSSIGVYGVASYVAALRTREIGIRIALGADRGRIRSLVLRQGAVPIAWGIAAGVLGAALAGRLATAFLRGVSPRDPLAYAAVIAVLAAVAFVATWIPARRAAGVDPIQALRQD